MFFIYEIKILISIQNLNHMIIQYKRFIDIAKEKNIY